MNKVKNVKEEHRVVSTIIAFGLIPLSGFATDIYIPSLPSMARDLNVATAAVQLSLVLFFISSGISQLFVGPILDSFGRYRAGLVALLLFAAASFAIAAFPDIRIIYAMRIVQGIMISIILVAKRAFFADLYSGEKLKHYTSLFVIIWSVSPILAPFIGGYLQTGFGWQSNFWLLGILAFVFLLLEMSFSGETLKHFHPFKARPIVDVYVHMLRTADFCLSLTILGCCYATVVMYAMVSPFIIERVFHFAPVATGYSSLLSGVAILIGGILAKASIKTPIPRKIPVALSLMGTFSGLIILTGIVHADIYVMVGLTVVLHMTGGFIFNTFFSYCLTRFSKNTGTAAGLTGGGMYFGSSLISYGLVNIYGIRNQSILGVANLTAVTLLAIIFTAFNMVRKSSLKSASAVEAIPASPAVTTD
jgi:MFS transporter, DHA1 family, multidrug resistance protein